MRSDDKDNVSPHASVSDYPSMEPATAGYFPSRDFGKRSPPAGGGFACGGVEQIDYSKFPPPTEVFPNGDPSIVFHAKPEQAWEMRPGAVHYVDKIPSQQETVCEEANRIVYGDREQTYGHPAQNFETTANFWTAYLNNKLVLGRPMLPLEARDVARMMSLLKLARQMHKHKRDNLVDNIGYIACEAKIVDYEAKS